MSEPYVGEIRLFSFNFAPKNWAICDGTVLRADQNRMLFSLIKGRYGGDGRTTFALPDLRGRVIVAPGPGFPKDQSGGVEKVTLTEEHLPSHTHPVKVHDGAADAFVNNGEYALADCVGITGNSPKPYVRRQNPDTKMSNKTCTTAGSGKAHNNMQPSIVCNYCIALTGLYPPKP